MKKKQHEILLDIVIRECLALREENERLRAAKPPLLKVICFEMRETYPDATIEEWLIYAAAKYPTVNPESLRVIFYKTDYKPPNS